MKKIPYLILSTAIALTGCASTNHNDEPKNIGQTTQEQPSLTQAQSTEVVEGIIDASGGKPGAPVTLRYEVPKTITSNTEISIKLEFTSRTLEGSLKIDLNTPNEILLQGTVEHSFELAENASYSLEVPVFTSNDGLYYLNVLASESNIEGPLMARAFAVPVQVGAKTEQKPHANLITDSAGEATIEMSAEESIP